MNKYKIIEENAVVFQDGNDSKRNGKNETYTHEFDADRYVLMIEESNKQVNSIQFIKNGLKTEIFKANRFDGFKFYENDILIFDSDTIIK